uniref:F-box associated domain-containing protein n=1 Tax=Aegilops tauschii TaxID=37682 RepID=M8BY56_AEGTA
MSKRRRADDEGRRSMRSHGRRHYLYIVVDDWTKGYSIYKVDVADFDGESGADLDSQASRLPEPPVFRPEFPHDCSSRFAAIGGRIVAMRYNQEENAAPVLLYDTATGGLALGPRTPAQVRYVSHLVSACGRLYIMGASGVYKGGDHFEVLAADEKGVWVWNAVPMAPFTISQAYYDGEVDAWVGLHRDSAEPGTVCSCDVVSAGDDEGLPAPAWKLAKEKMVCEETERTKTVTLTRMGRGKFCLVEHRSRKGVPTDVLDSRYLFYATTFKLRYDKNGGLRATACRTRSYSVPRQANGLNWWVFGI